MTWISNPTGGYGAGGNKSTKAQLKSGRSFFFDSFNKAHKFCEEHKLNIDECLHSSGTTHKITIP